MINTTFYPTNTDHLFADFEEATSANKPVSNYPPFNIFFEGEDDVGVIEVSCAGLSVNDLDVYFEDSTLIVEGTYPEKEERKYSHKGLSTKDFKRKFKLERNNQVDTVTVENGLMRITLKTVEPERQLITINPVDAEAA